MPSFQGKAIELLLRLIRQKHRMQRTRERVEAGKIAHATPSKQLYNRYHITTRTLNEHTVYTLSPKESTSNKHIYYLHGGSYVEGMATQHWHFLARLIDALGCTITVPDYPLPPTYHVDDVFAMILPLYQEIAADQDTAHLTIMGDSAGAGMALALAQQLRAKGLPQPGNIILLSPWLDVTMTNPDIRAIDKVDPFISVQGLIDAGELYANGQDRTNPIISPIYGSLADLAHITLFIGSHDLLCADARKLHAKAETEGVKIDYHEYQGMVHDWMLVSLPESKQVMRQIVARL